MVLEEGEKGQTGFFLVHLKLNGGLLNQALKRVDSIEIEISVSCFAGFYLIFAGHVDDSYSCSCSEHLTTSPRL